MDRLREMEMFIRVIEAGSFSAAARDLSMGQPAVSKMIASLEDRLGVRLLTRSTRKLSPTDAGTAFMNARFARLVRQTKRKLRRTAPARDWKAVYGFPRQSRSRVCT
jgi:DNA-binding transcriptional LysR family regulator